MTDSVKHRLWRTGAGIGTALLITIVTACGGSAQPKSTKAIPPASGRAGPSAAAGSRGEGSASSTLAVVQQYYAAVNRKDPAASAALFADDAVVGPAPDPSYPCYTPCTDREAILRAEEWLTSFAPFTDLAIAAAGNTAVVFFRAANFVLTTFEVSGDHISARHGDPSSWVAASARVMNAPNVSLSTPSLPGSTTVETVDTAGGPRRAIVYVPTSRHPGEPLPVILSLHPGGYGGAFDSSQISGLSQEAERLGFLAVYPQPALLSGWPDLFWNAEETGFTVAPKESTPDDIAFIGKLLDQLQTRYRTDPNRVYLTGNSDGGDMVYRFACAQPNRIAAIAVVDAARGQWPCSSSRPISVLHIHGTRARWSPYEGGHNYNLYPIGSVAENMAYWRRVDGCPADLTRSEVNSVVTRETSGPCREGSEVTLYTIEGGSDCWPGAYPIQAPTCVPGQPLNSFSATAVIVQFFFAHPRPSRRAP